MASYQVELAKSAVKDLRKIDGAAIPRILQAIEDLANEPRPAGSKKLVGSKNSYRIRIGTYRVIYRVKDQMLLIDVIRVRKRSDAYR